MKALTREKIALLVFALILVVALGALVAYIFLGHSWNVVATKVDDAASDMRDYTVVLFEGTGVPDARDGDFNGNPPVSLAAAKASYGEKGASVVVLDSVDPLTYRKPAVFKAGSQRVGVVYLGKASSKSKTLTAEVADLASRCDYVIALAPSAYIASTYSKVGIAIDLDTGDEKALASDQCQIVRTCGVGYVDAILISPSGVVSSRQVRSL